MFWCFFFFVCFCSDLARERNLKNQKKGQSAADTEANKGLSLQERQLRDAARYINLYPWQKSKHFIVVVGCVKNNYWHNKRKLLKIIVSPMEEQRPSQVVENDLWSKHCKSNFFFTFFFILISKKKTKTICINLIGVMMIFYKLNLTTKLYSW